MTPEAQRIAIAEACGWKKQRCSHGVLVHWTSMDWRGPNEQIEMPDYLNDLNAMHEAVLTLPPLLWTDYLQHLLMASVGLNGNMFYAYNATAGQCAEAFLRAIGKWKESV